MAFIRSREGQLQYYTAGTHGKWYFHWAVPPSVDIPGLNAAMSDIVGRQLRDTAILR